MFLSFDGIDGAGKSTQVERFADWLRQQGREVVTCRDPGSTQLGERVRGILLDPTSRISRRAEMLLYMAARAQMVAEIIRPALDEGKTVVSDRYLLSNVVYQGHAGGLDPAELWKIGRAATAGVSPDWYIVLDLPPEVADGRMSCNLDRMEQQGEEFRRSLRQGFLDEAAARPDEITVIDASPPPDEVQAAIRTAACERLGLSGE